MDTETKSAELKETNHETHAAITIAVALVTVLGTATGIQFYLVLGAIIILVGFAIAARIYIKRKKLAAGQPVSDEPVVNLDNIVNDVTAAVLTEIVKKKDPSVTTGDTIQLKKK